MADMAVKLVVGATTKTVGLGENADGSITRSLDELNWGELVATTFGHPLARGHGWVETARPTFSTPRQIDMVLRAFYAGSNPERNLRQDFEDMVELLTPRATTPVQLRVDTLAGGGGSVSRIQDVRLTKMPGEWSQIFKGFGTAAGSYTMPLSWEAKFPLWRDRTNDVVTASVSLSNANLDDPAVMAIAGVADAGLRIVLSNVTGIVTSVTVTNTTNGYAFTLSDTGLANNDYVDFMVTSPNDPPSWSGGTLNALADMALELGNNALTVAATGTGTWSLDIGLSTRQFWGHP